MKYGVFVDNDKIIHVAPSDEDGNLLPPHILDVFCICGPAHKKTLDGLILIHNSEN